MKTLGISLVIILMLASIALGAGFIVKTNNPDFKNDPEFYRSLGDEMIKRSEPAKAIKAYEESLALAEDLEVRNNLAVLYYQSAMYDDAISHLRVLIEAEYDNPSRHYDLAVNLVDKFRNTEDKNVEDLEEALTEYMLVEKLDPGFEYAAENSEVLKKVLGN